MQPSRDAPADTSLSPRLVVATVLALVTVVGAGIIALLSSTQHQLHDPVHALQQLDLLYLDEPAPAYDELGFQRGKPAVLVVCTRCEAPDVDAQVAVTDDASVAAAYALATIDGRVGPGYAVIDSSGRVRYRTFDAHVGDHALEVQTVVDGVD